MVEYSKIEKLHSVPLNEQLESEENAILACTNTLSKIDCKIY